MDDDNNVGTSLLSDNTFTKPIVPRSCGFLIVTGSEFITWTHSTKKYVNDCHGESSHAVAQRDRIRFTCQALYNLWWRTLDVFVVLGSFFA